MPYKPDFTDECREELSWRKKKDRANYNRIMKKISEILETPDIGKPLTHDLFGKRRVHIGHFVLSYKIIEDKRIVLFDGFEHHE